VKLMILVLLAVKLLLDYVFFFFALTRYSRDLFACLITSFSLFTKDTL
jgi:hypothetical protein